MWKCVYVCLRDGECTCVSLSPCVFPLICPDFLSVRWKQEVHTMGKDPLMPMPASCSLSKILETQHLSNQGCGLALWNQNPAPPIDDVVFNYWSALAQNQLPNKSESIREFKGNFKATAYKPPQSPFITDPPRTVSESITLSNQQKNLGRGGKITFHCNCTLFIENVIW